MQPADVDALHALWTTPEVREFLWDGEVIPRERTVSVYEESQRLFATNGYGLWLARDENQALIAEWTITKREWSEHRY